jgi:CheY-like chemotaxis protein
MVLVVDDHDDTRSVVLRMLGFEGYEAFGVPSGSAALQYLETATPDLMILDYNMPCMDGLELLAEVRKHARLQKMPVIMFSAGDGGVKNAAMRAGVEAYVIKGSLDWAAIHREIVRLIGVGATRPQQPSVDQPRSKEVG